MYNAYFRHYNSFNLKNKNYEKETLFISNVSLFYYYL